MDEVSLTFYPYHQQFVVIGFFATWWGFFFSYMSRVIYPRIKNRRWFKAIQERDWDTKLAGNRKQEPILSP